MLISVDAQDTPLGEISWEDAHRTPGVLHRAFSIYIFNEDYTQFLLQRRSSTKPLWPLILANSCCSHPRVGEETLDAATRRLPEELGFRATLQSMCSFVYRAEDPAGRGTEHEHVTVIMGTIETDVPLQPNPDEVAEARWIPVQELLIDMRQNGAAYAPWFHIGLSLLLPRL